MHSGGALFTAIVQATQPEVVEVPKLELWVHDPDDILALPENPRNELLARRRELARYLKEVHEFVITDELNARLTARVWDASCSVMYFCATGEAVKILQAAFHYRDKHLLSALRKALAEDRQKVSATIYDHLAVNRITHMPETFTELLRLINSANPSEAWQPMRS